ncbi:lytic transglycosylase domain-containing protein [Chelatococcus sp. SYSU_G07232]|uniref:Lytic transglycosylase domain-containing protein n=1 Tax=Chelatococcus albus TaxID=3047466 RepID=A0ABT7AJ18_9HYPH|nr:lytic transglycosylase domain-containing protein [Chelatococcus sp. SYSU_G07232]MDJ1159372.1 lytic transglycosylase domain-containing protein [Chelatococcus sp. SYSU_G07232]
MFLFTTPATRETAPAAATPVVNAIRQGADRTGVEFDYLLRTAQRESALDPSAKAKTSSASGLFQFIEQTWLGIVKGEGAKHGLSGYAGAIAERGNGGFTVDDPVVKQEILALRSDPQIAAVMAGALAQRNREALSATLGREPSAGDLYVAHVLGARGAADLIRTAQTAPTQSAAALFPEAASANRAIFYDKSGRARGAGEVYAALAASHAAMGNPIAVAMPPASAAPPSGPFTVARADGPAMHGLFRTEGRRGPVSEAVTRLWSAEAARSKRPEAPGARATLSFFPRSDDGGARIAALTPAAPEESLEDGPPRLVDAPLPPPRPAELGGSAKAARADGTAARSPLDLRSFMTTRRST